MVRENTRPPPITSRITKDTWGRVHLGEEVVDDAHLWWHELLLIGRPGVRKPLLEGLGADGLHGQLDPMLWLGVALCRSQCDDDNDANNDVTIMMVSVK